MDPVRHVHFAWSLAVFQREACEHDVAGKELCYDVVSQSPKPLLLLQANSLVIQLEQSSPVVVLVLVPMDLF